MMKNCILTPTYEGHFEYIKNYLSSFKKYVVDTKKMPICFILSSDNEKAEFNKIIKPYRNDIEIKVYVFDKIVKKFGLDINTDKVLKKYGHTSYQMLKKFYSMLYIDAETFLVLDSEAAWIKPVNMNDKFKEFYKNPYIIVSDFSSRLETSQFLKDHFAATNHVLGYDMKKMPFEHFMWFYKKDLIENIIQKYGKPYDLMLDVYRWEMKNKGYSVGLMETMLCLNYIYENAAVLGYRIIQAEDELQKYFGKKGTELYIKEFFSKTGGEQLGLLEFPCDRLTKMNICKLAEIFKNNNIWITRCDMVNIWNRKLIEDFIKEGMITLLAVGQEHIFLPDITMKEKNSIVFRASYIRIKILIKRFLKNILKR